MPRRRPRVAVPIAFVPTDPVPTDDRPLARKGTDRAL